MSLIVGLENLSNIIGVDEATIYNGAVAGYYSSSELLKLIRDIHFIKPDIVISLSGVNELDGHGHKGYQLLSRYQRNIFTKMARVNEVSFMPNTISIFRYMQNIRLVEGVDFGPYHGVNSFERWSNNISMMAAISRSVSSRYYVFLQPVIGVLDDKSKYFKNNKMNDKYLDNLRTFYTRAEQHCTTLEFCFSLTQLFPDDEEYYLDPRHQTRAGAKLISENIYNYVFGNN